MPWSAERIPLVLCLNQQFWTQILCCTFSGICDRKKKKKKKKNNELQVHCYLERTKNPLLYVSWVWCLGKNPTVNKSVSEANSGMCCFFQGLFLIEVKGICPANLGAESISFNHSMERMWHTWVCYIKWWDWELLREILWNC